MQFYNNLKSSLKCVLNSISPNAKKHNHEEFEDYNKHNDILEKIKDDYYNTYHVDSHLHTYDMIIDPTKNPDL